MLALVGPTACGKSALALAAARALGGEIIVADPFQRYRGVEIAADSPGAAETGAVPHHAVGDLDLTQRSTAADFAALAPSASDDPPRRGALPIAAGGPGLSRRAAFARLSSPAPPDPEVRAWAEALSLADPAAALAALAARDPGAAERVDRDNPRRVARALEIAADPAPRPPGAGLWGGEVRLPTLVVGLTRPREVLDRRIAVRVRRELDDGLVAELEAALDTPGVSREALQVIEAREGAAVRAGELEAADLPERLATRTRRLARKQLTWLRKTPGVVPLDLGDAPAEEALPRLLTLWREGVPDPVASGG